MLRVSIGRRRKCFPRIVSVLILIISVRKGGCPSKFPDAFLQEDSQILNKGKISCQDIACFDTYSTKCRGDPISTFVFAISKADLDQI